MSATKQYTTGVEVREVSMNVLCINYCVLFRANNLQLSVLRAANCIITVFNRVYMFGILWSAMTNDYRVEFFWSDTGMVLAANWAIIIFESYFVQGRGGNWTTWISCVAFPLVCKKPATKYRNADIKSICKMNTYRNTNLSWQNLHSFQIKTFFLWFFLLLYVIEIIRISFKFLLLFAVILCFRKYVTAVFLALFWDIHNIRCILWILRRQDSEWCSFHFQ